MIIKCRLVKNLKLPEALALVYIECGLSGHALQMRASFFRQMKINLINLSKP